MTAVLTGMKQNLNMTSICISMMAKGTEHFSKYFLAACISSLGTGQFISLAQFLTWWFVFFGILFRSFSPMTDINIIFGVELVQFLPFCRRTLHSVDFAPPGWGRQAFNLLQPICQFLFFSVLLESSSGIVFLSDILKQFTCVVSGFALRSCIHSELTFCRVRAVHLVSVLLWVSSFPNTVSRRCHHFSNVYFWHFCFRPRGYIFEVHFLVLCSTPRACVALIWVNPTLVIVTLVQPENLRPPPWLFLSLMFRSFGLFCISTWIWGFPPLILWRDLLWPLPSGVFGLSATPAAW